MGKRKQKAEITVQEEDMALRLASEEALKRKNTQLQVLDTL